MSPEKLNSCSDFGNRMVTLGDKGLRDLDVVNVYLDDIIVTGDLWEIHLDRLRNVFERLRNYDVTVNLAKCEFGKATVKYLGHEIGNGLVKPLECYIESIMNFSKPQTKKQLMSFLGSVGYYRKFCRNFSDIASPSTQLLKKNHIFKWKEECNNTFENLKLILISKPVIHAPCFEKPFKLHIDSSEIAAGGVLLQENNEVLYPVAYFSKKYNDHQQRL